MRELVVFVLCLLLVGCASKQDLEEAKKRIAVLEDSIEQLRNTPHERLARAGELSGAEAESVYTALVEAYPQSPEAKIARESLKVIAARREAARAARERRQRLGFRALEESRTVEVAPTQLRFTSVSTDDRFTYDRYDDRYHYREAKRGHLYIVATVRITADEEELDPDLPAVHVYRADGDRLSHVGTMDYEFYDWEDYGSYLGNEHDSGNDFETTATIPFSLGLEVDNSTFEDAIFVMVEDRNCADRGYSSDNPEVYYSTYECTPSPNLKTLSVGEAEELHAVEVFNKDTL